MSGTASVSNQFQNRTPSIPLADLDENFDNVTDYLNNPTNRYNFAVAGGAANTYSVTLSPPALGYTRGLEINFFTTNTNTGSSVVNVNGLGNKSIVTITGAAAGANQIQRIAKAIYDGTAFVLISADTSGGGGSTSGLYLALDGSSASYRLQHVTYTQTSAVLTFNFAQANIFETTLNATVTAVSITNAPSGTYGELGLWIHQASTATFPITWSSAYTWPGGATHAMSTTTSALDVLSLKTTDGGTFWRVDYSQGYS
jgi:hypothetical protein